MSRYAKIVALLTRIAKWAAVICLAAFLLLIGVGLTYGRTTPNLVLIAATVLTAIATGCVSLIAFALRGAIEERWRFSLAGLLATTTALAIVLGLIVFTLRRN